MENFDLDFIESEQDDYYPVSRDEYSYFDTFTLIHQLEQKVIPQELMTNESFLKIKTKLYSNLNINSNETILETLDEINEMLDIKENILYYLHCAFYFQNINTFEYLVMTYNYDLMYSDFYFVKLAIKYNFNIVFDYLIIQKLIDTFKELTEDGNSCLCFTVKYNRMAMMYKLLNTLDKKTQTKESLLLVQYALLTKNISILNLLYLHDYIDIKLIKDVSFTV